MPVLNFLSRTKKYTANDSIHGNGPYGKILTKKELIRTVGFTLPYSNVIILYVFCTDLLCDWYSIVVIVELLKYGLEHTILMTLSHL